MKKAIVFYLLLLVACNNNRPETATLEGVYTAYHEHEYGKTNDTLTVSKPNEGSSIYQIIRHSGVVRTAEGKVYPKKIIEEIYIVKYDEKNKILDELKTGKIFVWNSANQVLILGKTQFKKM